MPLAKALSRLGDHHIEQGSPKGDVCVQEATKTCPACGKAILAAAITCKHCKARIDEPADRTTGEENGEVNQAEMTEQQNSGDTKECPACGQIIKASGDTKECPACGQIIKAAAIKCRYCKSKLDSGVDPQLGHPPRKKLLAGILIVVGGLLGFLAIVAFLLGHFTYFLVEGLQLSTTVIRVLYAILPTASVVTLFLGLNRWRKASRRGLLSAVNARVFFLPFMAIMVISIAWTIVAIATLPIW